MMHSSALELDHSQDPLSHVISLAYSRSTNSTGDTKACLYIQNQLKSVGIESRYEYFSFDTPFRILMRLIYLITLTYLVFYRLLLIIAFYFAVKYLFATTRNFSLTRKEESKNLIATIPAERKRRKRPVAIISAHYDSFSANLPYRLQNVAFFLFRIIIFPYFIITMSFSIIILTEPAVPILSEFNLGELIITSSLFEFAIVLIIFLLIYDTQKSKGAIDNASGVAVLIELAKLIKKYQIENYDVILLFPGTEEWGLIGSKRYVKRNHKYLSENYDLDRSFNINIDMVGSYVGMIQKRSLFRKHRHRHEKHKVPLNDIIDEVSSDLNIEYTKDLHFITPKTDHKSFNKLASKTKSKFQVVCFHSDKDSKYIHSRLDTPDKCSSEVLSNAISLIFNTLKTVDSII
ncbi:MAG: M28 family peptidase [Promethearchaeota archaeon]|nr:MAG: M28 family peptidase [Candidatus Lokiarchaeota archaeon]